MAPNVNVPNSVTRVFIADAEVNAVAALRELLETDGYEVVASTDARETLAILERSAFDALIVDLDMPGMTGDALVRIKRMRNRTACFFITTERPSRLPEGACHLFGKPLDYENTRKWVERCRAPGHHGCHMKEAKRPSDREAGRRSE